jgi:hypothetical protein
VPFRTYLLCASCRGAIRREFAHYRRWALGLLAACLLLSGTGCSWFGNGIHQTVAIDGDFPPYEMAQIQAAMATWSEVTPATFDVVVVPHMNLGAKDADVTIYMRATEADRCPTGDAFDHGDLEGIAGVTYWKDQTHRVICLHSWVLLALDHSDGPETSHYLGTVEHELGHTMGLAHVEDPDTDYPTLMNAYMGPAQTDHPTCVDLAQFRSIWQGEYDAFQESHHTGLDRLCAGVAFHLSGQ